MSSRLNRKQLTDALIAAGVETPPNITIIQLRTIYEQTMSRQINSQPDNVAQSDVSEYGTENIESHQVTDADDEAHFVDAQVDPNVDAAVHDVIISAAAAPNVMISAAASQNAVNSVAAVPVTMTSAGNMEIDQEMELLQKRKQILELRQQIRLLEREDEPAVSVRRIDPADIEQLMNKFSGDDTYYVEKFFSDFEEIMAGVRHDRNVKFMCLRRLLTGTARIYLSTTSAVSYEGLKAELIDEFKQHFSRQEVYQQLQNRVWEKRGESLKRYVLEMQAIASRADIGEDELIDFVVNGLRVPDASVLLTARSIAELKDLLGRHERRIMSRVSVLSAREGGSTKTKLNTAAAAKVSTGNKATINEEAVRCFNCSRNGHYQSKCPYEKRPAGTCFRCWKAGHDHFNCPNPKKILVAMNNAVAAAVTEANDLESTEDGLNDAISAINLVSVAYVIGLNECTEFMNCLSLFDTGSPVSFVKKSIVPLSTYITTFYSKYRGLGNTKLYTYGKIQCQIKFRNRCHDLALFILPDETMAMPMILGRDFLSIFKIQLCQIDDIPKKIISNKIFIDEQSYFCAFNLNNLDEVASLPDRSESLSMFGNTNSESILPVQAGSLLAPNIDAPPVYCDDSFFADICAIDVTESEPLIDISNNLGKQDTDILRAVVINNYLSPTDVHIEPYDYEMSIRLTNDVPFHSMPRRLSYYERTEVQKIVRELLEKRIIRPSSSPYASAIVLVKKKSGEMRMCVDYRSLNRLTIRDNYPLPLIEDCIEYLEGKQYFTVLDLCHGFHQVRMAAESIKYTSFVTPDGQYEYEKMPFGLKNAPAVFQRFICNIFRDLIDSHDIIIYMDDILIATADFKQHLQLVTAVLRRLASKGLELKLKKCKFGYGEIDYLGYSVSPLGIRPSDSHIRAIRHYPMPKNARELKTCLGLFSYFRKFVPSFTRIARPLQALMREGVAFRFTDECVGAFVELRDRLASAPVLAIYSPKRETELHCDASSAGFGAVLMQRLSDGKFHPVLYFSKATTAAESKYHSFELETLAIIYALRRFRVYLEGIPFRIVTDCNSLTMTLGKKQVNPRIARWALELENYNYTIQHRSGVSMGHVDALSRCLESGAAEDGGLGAPLEPVEFHRIVSAVDCGAGHLGNDIGEGECRLTSAVNADEVDFYIQVTQNRDGHIRTLRERLEMEPVRGYELQNGLVFRINGEGLRQLFVPTEMEDNVIRLIHEKIGHLGIEKSCSQLRKHYWFPNMKDKVERFIRNCIRCIMYSAPARLSEHTLHNIPKIPIPFDTIHLDHFGPLPSINSKRKYVLVIIDAFTKFVRLYPTNSTSTREVIACLDKYFSYYSRPRRVITDRGTCFRSLEFDSYLSRHNVVHIKVAVQSAQANGQVERVNSVLRAALSKLCEPINHSDWSNLLTQVEYGMNNTIHGTTKQSPSQLLFGVEQRGKIVDELTEYLDARGCVEPDRNLDQIRSSAYDAIERSQEYNLKYFLEHSTPARTYSVGDYVVIRNVDTTAGTNKKLIPKFRGPYVVHKILPNDRYVIKDIENCQITQLPYDGIVEAARMRKWIIPREEADVVASGDCEQHKSE